MPVWNPMPDASQYPSLGRNSLQERGSDASIYGGSTGWISASYHRTSFSSHRPSYRAPSIASRISGVPTYYSEHQGSVMSRMSQREIFRDFASERDSGSEEGVVVVAGPDEEVDKWTGEIVKKRSGGRLRSVSGTSRSGVGMERSGSVNSFSGTRRPVSIGAGRALSVGVGGSGRGGRGGLPVYGSLGRPGSMGAWSSSAEAWFSAEGSEKRRSNLWGGEGGDGEKAEQEEEEEEEDESWRLEGEDEEERRERMEKEGGGKMEKGDET
ncbi:hypothetical protein BC829DRAFT_89542 [Chytridium lagenaria]|nr:hypothetical protein BC829DRAFT_89542 [Chytridium lagenaria]